MGMKKDMLSKGPELLADLGERATAVLCKNADLDADKATQVARELVDVMRLAWGGQLIYFPKGDSLETAERDLNLWADFTGDNQAELAKKYKLSIQQVYKKLREVRKAKIRDSQHDLFEG
ncbi:MAG: DNA-binding protein [gamma proteobacterium endosymbiont of Lamellibrachia anaximandri]|nr:DNA-binding protein [gamma proteobacterium endosymbiont of Lamellibrachia anaximandri]